MNNNLLSLLLLGFLSFLSYKLAQQKHNINYVESRHSLEELEFIMNKPLIVDFIPYNREVILEHSKKIYINNNDFLKEAELRNIVIVNPIMKYKFSMRSPIIKKMKLDGFCWLNENKIYLKIDFHSSVYYHELGHCEFRYSHKFDANVALNGKSKFIMNWDFDKNLLKNKKDNVLNEYFNDLNHKRLNTVLGKLEHQAMQTIKEQRKLLK